MEAVVEHRTPVWLKDIVITNAKCLAMQFPYLNIMLMMVMLIMAADNGILWINQKDNPTNFISSRIRARSARDGGQFVRLIVLIPVLWIVDWNSFDRCQPYDVADLLKQFLRELPECLLTNKLGATLIDIFYRKFKVRLYFWIMENPYGLLCAVIYF